MEYNIHRLKFGDWVPSPVRSIAIDPFSSFVAIGREDGEIEILDSFSKWNLIARISGRDGFQLRSLHWSTINQFKGRLFGISLLGFIFEVDLKLLLITNIRDVYGGSAWCFDVSPTIQQIAVGCEDGSIRFYIYDKIGSHTLEYSRMIPSINVRVLSMVYHPSSPTLYIGCSDGSIRSINTNTNSYDLYIIGDKIKNTLTFILSLQVLSDSTVISGDNHGNIQLWDGISGVLTLNIHQHTADILAIAISNDEKQIFVSGVDSKIICIQSIQSTHILNDNQWVYASSHRPHSHDVYCLAISSKPFDLLDNIDNSDSKEINSYLNHTLLSGGLDGNLNQYSTKYYSKYRPLRLMSYPPVYLTTSTTDGSLLVMKQRRYLDIYHIPSINNQLIESTYQLATRIELSHVEFIYSVSISPNGKYLALSTIKGLRIYLLLWVDKELTIERLQLPNEANIYCHTISFNINNQCLGVVTMNNDIILLDIIDNNVSVRSNITDFNHNSLSNSDSLFSDVINQIIFSDDNQYLVINFNVIGHCYIYDIDSFKLHWKIKPLFTNQTLSTISFLSYLSTAYLCLLYSSNTFVMFDINKCEYVNWLVDNNLNVLTEEKAIEKSAKKKKKKDKDNSNETVTTTLHNFSKEYSENFPDKLLQLEQPLVGISIHDNSIFLYNSSTVVNINLSSNYPISKFMNVKKISYESNRNELANKRKSIETTNIVNKISITNMYSGIIHFKCISSNTILILENPRSKVLEKLPQTLYRKIYGS